MPKEDQPNGAQRPDPEARRPLREATLIQPNGRRVKRNVTFGQRQAQCLDGTNTDEPSYNEDSPLLPAGSDGHEPGFGQRLQSYIVTTLHDACEFANSTTGRGIVKCSMAYFLGSLGTFWPVIANLLGQQDGKHMVATVTVYYHPARSIGSMFEATLCAAAAFLYAVFISFSSMGVSILFGRTLDMAVLGHCLVLIMFCGAGLGFVGWTKQRLGHPLVNISCSLTCLAIITVLTKEGAVQASEFSNEKVTQVMIMILLGVTATTAVCFLISPTSARTALRKDVAKVTDSFNDLLSGITRAFLTGREDELDKPYYHEAFENHKKVFSTLAKNLEEAKYEHYIMGTEKTYALESRMVNCLQRLSQSIGGLRSAANTQFLLLAQTSSSGTQSPSSRQDESQSLPRIPVLRNGYASGVRNDDTMPESIAGTVEAVQPMENNGLVGGHEYEYNDTGLPPLKSTSDIFARFIIQLGPSMKSLAVSMAQILVKLPYDDDGRIVVDAHHMSSLDSATGLYTKSRQKALQMLYASKDLTAAQSLEIVADLEEVAASCGYFSFSLQDLAQELKIYLQILDDLKLEQEERPGGRTWRWMKLWKFKRDLSSTNSDPEQDSLIDVNAETDLPGKIPGPEERKLEAARSKGQGWPEQTSRHRLWTFVNFFCRDDIKFAIKVGIGAALYASPSFLGTTRPFYQHWRGEWGLLSYMLVCAMTLGASNTTGYARFLGTCIGAICAVITWTLSGGNVYLLAFFGWLMSIWTAYIILAQGKGPMGRFIMLTYNLSALYAYSLSVNDVDGDEDEGGIDPVITEITLHRVAAVLSGCLWGLIITRVIWPISARSKLKDGLSILWLRMGLIWKRDPLNTLLEESSQSTYMDLREEFDLRRFLIRLDNMRGAAKSEADLRGLFPDAAYDRILQRTGAMLDAFHAMNIMITKNPKASHAELDMLDYTASERQALCTRISHLFQVLASSMKLEFPMSGALPSIDHTRDRFLARMFQFRSEKKDEVTLTDEDFELLYAYALVTGQLSDGIKDIGKEIEMLFGLLNEDLLKLQ